jgi:hypothetical protein
MTFDVGHIQSPSFKHIYSPHQWQTVASTNNHWEAQTMQERANATVAVLEQQITERYGLLISQTQFAWFSVPWEKAVSWRRIETSRL